MRITTANRKTSETDVKLTLNLDGTGLADIRSGCGFLDHMLTLFARHGRFDLTLSCQGDTAVDDHHTVEDIGICLGRAFAEALGDGRGIRRYGSLILPMDEALILCAVDFSGRGFLSIDCQFPTEKIGTFDTQLVAEFWSAFARCAGLTLHLKKLDGRNSHHISEAAFKASARAIKESVLSDPLSPDEIPSTKGVLL